MKNRLENLSVSTTARLAGVGYLILAICGGFAEFGVRQKLLVSGDVAATAQNLMAHAQLWRLGITLELIGQVAFIFLVFALFEILKVVNRKRATMMVALVLVAISITCLNMVNQFAALHVLESGAWAAAMDPAQLAALSTLFLDLHHFGYSVVAQVFFGLWLLPLAALIWTSGFIPRIIGAFLAVAGVGYLIDVVLAAMVPDVAVVVSEFTFLGELLLMGWLLVRGVNAARWSERTSQTPTAFA